MRTIPAKTGNRTLLLCLVISQLAAVNFTLSKIQMCAFVLKK